MNTYKVKVKLVWEGEVEVESSSMFEARSQAEKHFGAVSPNFHSASPQIKDWNFPVHPEKYVKSVKKQ